MKVEPTSAPYEILSSFNRNVNGVLEKHRYVKVHGSTPIHITEYIVYNKQGKIEKSSESSFDKLA